MEENAKGACFFFFKGSSDKCLMSEGDVSGCTSTPQRSSSPSATLNGASVCRFQMQWNRQVKDMNHRVGSRSKSSHGKSGPKDTSKSQTCMVSFERWCLFFLPASLWQTWCAAGKEHFHKCFILPPPGRASLELELWHLADKHLFMSILSHWRSRLCLQGNWLGEKSSGSEDTHGFSLALAFTRQF